MNIKNDCVLTNEYYGKNEKLKKELSKRIELFSPLEQEIVNLRFGLKDGESNSIEKISKKLKLRRKKVSDILNECLKKFRSPNPYDCNNKETINYEVNSKLRKELCRNLDIFNEVEKVVLCLRFGFNGFKPLPFDILVDIFNRTPGEILEIEMEAIKKYHNFKFNLL